MGRAAGVCEVSPCVRVCMSSSCYKSSLSRRCVCVCLPACVCFLIAQMNIKKVWRDWSFSGIA